MDTILSNQATLWLTLGFILLAIELLAFGFAGVLLFGSLGALLTGTLLWLEVLPNNFVSGVSCFAVSTAVITALLWIPLRRLQSGAEMGNDRSSDLIGHTFVVNSDISHSDHGVHKYSGISWRVEPSKDYLTSIAAGSQVRVTAVNAGVFFVEPVS
jgi:membrane protein implicated in regulation of membrane protease activity